MKLLAPAKINRYLKVHPPDASGYHPIETEFQAIGLFDELKIERADADLIECDWQDLPEDNTLSKTLRLVRELVPLPPVRIVLRKRIPVQAGLGGGSSDAAAVLRWIVASMPDSFSLESALVIARGVGADVPFFLIGGRARGTGYGEILEPLPDEPALWATVVMPKEAVSTPGAYAALDARRLEARELDESQFQNDFESVAPEASMVLKKRLEEAGAAKAMLCGSGAAVYGLFASAVQAERAAAAFTEQNWVVPTLTREESVSTR